MNKPVLKCFKPGNKKPHTVSAGSNKKVCPTHGDTVQSYHLKKILDDVRRGIAQFATFLMTKT